MSLKKHGFLKKVLSGVLSAACVLSTAAVTGAVASTTASAASTTASATKDTPFSWDNASVYFLLTDRFYNGDTSNDHSYGRGQKNGQNVSYDTTGAFQGGDFSGITKKINEGYFTDLGVNAIWLSAPYEQIHGYCVAGDGDSFAHYSYHGYYVLDYTESDKNFGTKEEFKEMVDTAHEHGIRIVMDIVMNHAGYNTIQDMYEYGFGELKDGWQDYYYSHNNVNNTTYHGFVNYDASASVWGNWWGPDWIRCGLPGYTQGSGDIEGSLAGLPDFKTGSSNQVGLPKLLQTKWGKEGTLAAKTAKYGSSDTVTGYISTWLAEWVREYGVDGFRCDTAKHVELSAWKQLKDKCVAALREWKAANPTKKLDDLDFWMTGECFGHKAEKSSYYTQGGFDSMINFEFAPAVNSSNIPSAGSVDSTYSRYANSINNDPSFNVLSYLASHDTTLIKGDRKYAGSFLLMLPGGIQIYYGDESNRPLVNTPKANADPGAGHQLRSFMNWDSMDKDVLAHWQKLGQFRNNHLSVGAGSHKVISAYDSSNGYTFARTYDKNGVEDKVVVTLFASANKEVTIDVSSVWSDGMSVTNAYDGTTATVSGGKVTFNSGANGTILIEDSGVPMGVVTVKHINQDDNTTIKTEKFSGVMGESYNVSPLSTEGFKLARTVGSKTGTYSETPAEVTFYYTFDDTNYAYVKSEFVDAASGAALADPVVTVGKIGSTYSVSPVDVKDYEVDLSQTTNATGTVKAGTTTVTFKYNYVEPDNLQVHYYNANSFSTVSMYAYQGDGTTAKQLTGAWPGKTMTAESDGWFYCSVDGAEDGLVIFSNNGANQEPTGVGSAGYKASGEVWIKNGKVYPTGKVKVNYVTSNGKVLGSETLKGMADGTNAYKTSAKNFDGYTLTTTPANATGTYTEGTTTVTYVYSGGQVEVTSVSLDKTSASIKVGASTTLTATVNPSNAADKSISWKTSNAKVATVSNGKVTGVAAGTATITASSANGKTATCKVTVTANTTTLTNKSTISATAIDLGNSITARGAATGGTTPYKYAFYYKKTSESSWTTAKAYSTTSSVSIKPAAATTYDICIKVKDSNGTEAKKYFTVSVTKPVSTFKNTTTISATAIDLGGSVTLKGSSTGAVGTVSYSYSYKLSSDTSYTLISAYSTTASKTFKPTKVGVYTIVAKAKDGSGTVSSKNFTLNVSDGPLQGNATISATSISLGNTVTAKGTATGGTGGYKYAFYYKKASSSSWTEVRGYTTTATATIKPQAATTYNVCVKIKDSAGTVFKKYFTVKVGQAAALTNSSTLSATSITLGSSITAKGAATGGTAPYKYAFYYKKTSQTSWTEVRGYSTTATATIKPQAATTYDVCVKVKDSKSTVAKKYFTVKVSATTALTNKSTLSATSVTLGSSITAKGAATGGSGSYQYAYYYKKTSDTSWTQVKGYSTTTAVKITPKAAKTYDVCVKVKDSTGKEAKKYFTVKVTAGELTNNSTISATSISLGSTITAKGAAAGGSGSYQYAYYYKKTSDTSWTTAKAYSTTTSVSIKPAKATNYNVCIKVKDSTGAVVDNYFNLTVR